MTLASTEKAKTPSAAERHGSLSGRAIIAAIKASGIGTIAALPDITTAEGLLKPLAKERDLRLVMVCKEDEGIGICAGLGYCGKRSLLLIQSTGLMDSVNALRAIAAEYGQPICMMVGLIGNEGSRSPRDSENVGVRIVPRILDTLGIARHLLDTTSDVALIQPAIERAYRTSSSVALLIGRPPE